MYPAKFIVIGLIELRLDVFRSHRSLRFLKATTEIEKWITAMVLSLADHGYRQSRWPTYLDLEVLYSMIVLCEAGEEKSNSLAIIDEHVDKELPYGLLSRLNSLDQAWPNEVPAFWRARLIRALLLENLAQPKSLARMPQVIYRIGHPLDWEYKFIALQNHPDGEEILMQNMAEILNALEMSFAGGWPG